MCETTCNGCEYECGCDEDIEVFNTNQLIHTTHDGEVVGITFVNGEHITDYVQKFRQFLLAIGFHPDSVDEYVPYVEI